MMKNILMLCFLICATRAFAVITIQRGSETLLYNTLDEVNTAMLDGDVILIPGGVYGFGSTKWTISKQVSIYGTGYKDNVGLPYRTQINVSIEIPNTGQYISVSGIYFTGWLYVGTSNGGAISDIMISRCSFGEINTDNAASENFLITESVFRNGGDFRGSNSLFSNCLFGNSFDGYNAVDTFGNTFQNCVFIGSNGAHFENSYVSNCIFKLAIVTASGNIFENNMFLVGNSNIGANNNIQHNTLYFTNLSGVFDGQSNVGNYIESNSYHLQLSCPGVNYGTDGTDVGIYGGNYPWKESTLPSIPVITNAVVPNQTETNGALPVQITVVAQDN
jgi:hypothetical protein